MDVPLLRDLLIIFGLAIAVILVCHKLHVTSIVGFLLTGILAGPNGFGLISAVHEVEILAEVGVVLLLFTIGIEFSMEEFVRIKRSILMGGGLQVAITVLVVSFVFQRFGLAIGRSVFIGFLISLSSTAIVLKILQEKAQIESPHGQNTLAILIFQDIAVVPMMLMIPFLAGAGESAQASLLLLKGIGIVLLVMAAAKWVVPQVLYQIARTRSRELFLLSTLTVCFGVAFATYGAGLSLALGAFLAGLIISETEFSQETLGNIIPFRDVFTSLFFVSIGMLLDFGFLIQHPAQILLIGAAVMTLKTLIGCFAVLLLGFPLRTGILTGLALSQVGEFSFILFMEGANYGLLTGAHYQLFLNVSVLTMGMTPFIIAWAPKVSEAAARVPLPGVLKAGFGKDASGTPAKDKLKNHLIIVGYGFNGKNLALTAKMTSIPYVVIEMNPETVKRERKKGEPIFYGDASSEEVLESVWIEDARVLVVVISDPLATRRIVAVARKSSANLFIVARTRFVTEMAHLSSLGANEVIPEEFETSVEIFSRVLANYLIPRDEIERLITKVRAGGYQVFRSMPQQRAQFSSLDVQLPEVEISNLRVEAGSPLEGKSLAEIQLRRKYGVTLLAVRRGDRIFSNPGSETIFLSCDILILIGRPDDLGKITGLFRNPEKGAGDDCFVPTGDQSAFGS